MMSKHIRQVLTCFLAMSLLLGLTACGSSTENTTSESTEEEITETEETAESEEIIEIENGISSVYALGFLDYDGAKVGAVAVEYSVDLTGADVSVNDFEVGCYPVWNENKVEIGENAGVPVAAYINDEPAVSETGGSGSGNYVIIELSTDYQLSAAEDYTIAMSVDVLQTGTIITDRYTILPGTEAVGNYIEQEHTTMMGTVTTKKYANEGSYLISGGEEYVFHTVDGTGENAPFYATRCFDEATGLYTDVTVPYMIYVPEDYDDSGNYGLVVMIGSAGCASNDGMVTMCESMGPTDLASEEVQQYAKDAGLDGVIVLLPQVPEDLRSTRDNWTISSAVSAHWQLIDYIVDTYSIDTDRIYGTGHSMGCMQILEMAAERDNYFAAIWAIAGQWGENYNQEELFEGDAYYTAPADGTIIWTVDADGNACDYKNWVYMVSDDNILITNCLDDPMSSATWQELAYLYEDLCGVTFPKVTVDPLSTTDEEKNAALSELLAMDSDNGFYWLAFEGGTHTGTWVYAHHVTAGYQWLLSQTRGTEQEREKLDLDKPFELADEQILTDERILGTTEEGETVYFATGKSGAGTADYNSPVYAQEKPANEPDWDPEPLTLETIEEDSGDFACVVLKDGTVISETGVNSCEEIIANNGVSGEYAAIHVVQNSEEDSWEMVVYGEQPEWFDIEMYRTAWYAFAEWEYQNKAE